MLLNESSCHRNLFSLNCTRTKLNFVASSILSVQSEGEGSHPTLCYQENGWDQKFSALMCTLIRTITALLST